MFRSTVGLKFIMAVTGAGLVCFAVAHLLGNLQVFRGPEAINGYARLLRSSPGLLGALRMAVTVLVATHVTTALVLRRLTLAARPTPYAVVSTVQATVASRTMLLVGVLIVTYLGLHLLHFTVGPALAEAGHAQEHDVYSMVTESFVNPVVSLIYLGGVAFLAFHLSHGIASLLKSLGLNDKRYNATLQSVGVILATLIFLGYASIPLAVLTGLVKPAGPLTAGLGL
jgi:succinate dehydrogenase / fumarate reductase cytochrome b subunit